MRGMKIMAIVGLAVALAGWLYVGAVAQSQPPLPFNAVKITCNIQASVIGLSIFGIVRDPVVRPQGFETTVATASAMQGAVEVPCGPGQPVVWSLANGTLINMAPKVANGEITQLTGADLVYFCAPPPNPGKPNDVIVKGAPPWFFPCPTNNQAIKVETSGGPVPTLSQWGLIALAVLLAGSLAWMIRRRVIARPAGAA